MAKDDRDKVAKDVFQTLNVSSLTQLSTGATLAEVITKVNELLTAFNTLVTNAKNS